LTCWLLQEPGPFRASCYSAWPCTLLRPPFFDFHQGIFSLTAPLGMFCLGVRPVLLKLASPRLYLCLPPHFVVSSLLYAHRLFHSPPLPSHTVYLPPAVFFCKPVLPPCYRRCMDRLSGTLRHLSRWSFRWYPGSPGLDVLRPFISSNALKCPLTPSVFLPIVPDAPRFIRITA